MPESQLERMFAHYLVILAGDRIPTPEREHRFHPTRDWRFDFAWPALKVAVEVEGGTWVTGRHSRGSGFAKDAEKYNAAVGLGWFVLRYTTDMLEADPSTIIDQVVGVLRMRQLAVHNNRA